MNLFGAIGNLLGGAEHFIGGLVPHNAPAPQQNYRPINLGQGSPSLQGGQPQQIQRPAAPMIQIPHINLNTMQLHQIPTPHVPPPSAQPKQNYLKGPQNFNKMENPLNLLTGLAQGAIRGAGGLELAVGHAFDKNLPTTYIPTGISKTLLGKAPVQSSVQSGTNLAKAVHSPAPGIIGPVAGIALDASGLTPLGAGKKTAAEDTLAQAAKLAKDYPSFLRDAESIEKMGGGKFKSDIQAQNFFLKHNPTGTLTSGGKPLMSGSNPLPAITKGMPAELGTSPRSQAIRQAQKIAGVFKLNDNSGAARLGTITGGDAVKGAAGKTRGFITTMKNSDNVSPEVKGMLDSTYSPQSDKVIAANTSKFMKQGLPKATESIHRILTGDRGTLSSQDFSHAMATAQAHDAKGNFEQANQIYSLIAEHRTPQAQALRGGGAFAQRTPQALKYQAQKTIAQAEKESGKTIATPELNKSIDDLVKEAGKSAAGSDARQFTTQKLIKVVNDALPSKLSSKLREAYIGNLVSGPETATKVAVSQPFNIAMHYAAQAPAALGDAIQSAIRAGLGKGARRSTALTGQGIISGAKRGAAAIPTKLRTGLDLPNTGGFQSDFGKNIGQPKYVQKIFAVHGALSKPGAASVFDNTIAQQAKTAAINQGLKGSERQAFIDKFIANPTDTAKKIATQSAEEATNQQRTAAGRLTSAIKGIPVAGPVIAPITRVPSAIGTNALYNYSGLKLGVDAYKAIKTVAKGGEYTQEAQRIISQDIGRTAVGAGGLGLLGAGLAKSGNMTLQAPTDPKEKALWQAEGKQANSVKIMGHWISLNALGPVGIEMAMGAGFGSKGPVGAGLAGLKTLADQPYLKGISAFGQAINNPVQNANTYINSVAGSIIPSAVQQTARGTDTQQRVYPTNLVDTFKAGIPGVRGQLPAQHDLFGNTLPGAAAQNGGGYLGGLLGTINPFLPSGQRNTNDQPTQELQRLYTSLGSQGAPPIGQPKKGETVNGVKIKGSDAQLQQMVAQAGPQIHAGIQQAIQNPTYQTLNDTQKSDVIKGVIDNSRGNAKIAINGNPAQQAALAAAKGVASPQGAISNNSLYYQNENGKVSTINLSPKTAAQTNTTLKNLYQQLQNKAVTQPDFLSAIKQLKSTPQQAETAYARSLGSEDKAAFVMDKLGSKGSNPMGLARAGILTTTVASDLYQSGKLGDPGTPQAQRAYAQLYAAAAQTSKDLKAAREGGGYGTGKKYNTVSGKAPTKIPSLKLAKLSTSSIKLGKTVRVPAPKAIKYRAPQGAAPKTKQVVLA